MAPAFAQPPAGGYQDRKKVANESVVTIMGSGTASPYTLLAEDIQNVVDEPDIPGGLRVLPILGRGATRTPWMSCSSRAWTWALSRPTTSTPP